MPLVAILAAIASGTTVVNDARELRVKEADRVKAVVDNLNRMGGKAREKEDGFVVEGPSSLHGARIETYGDHRIAMSFAVAGLLANGKTEIKDAGCVQSSFPQFFQMLRRLHQDG